MIKGKGITKELQYLMVKNIVEHKYGFDEQTQNSLPQSIKGDGSSFDQEVRDSFGKPSVPVTIQPQSGAAIAQVHQLS